MIGGWIEVEDNSGILTVPPMEKASKINALYHSPNRLCSVKLIKAKSGAFM